MNRSTVLNGRVALVTGATGGIGFGIAHALAANGASVAFSGFADSVRVKEIRTRLTSLGVQAIYADADAQDSAQIERMVSTCESELGAVDILVNCAGVQHVSPVETFPVDKWNSILAINLSAAFHTIRCALPGMRRRAWGRIINIASVHGLVASAEKAAYVASKHGLIGLTKVVALETALAPITCNAICPGWVRTPLVDAQIEARAKSLGLDFNQAQATLLQEKQPSRSFVDVEQIGKLAVFLASDAADEVRGAAWTIDGGWTAQ